MSKALDNNSDWANAKMSDAGKLKPAQQRFTFERKRQFKNVSSHIIGVYIYVSVWVCVLFMMLSQLKVSYNLRKFFTMPSVEVWHSSGYVPINFIRTASKKSCNKKRVWKYMNMMVMVMTNILCPLSICFPSAISVDPELNKLYNKLCTWLQRSSVKKA